MSKTHHDYSSKNVNSVYKTYFLQLNTLVYFNKIFGDHVMIESIGSKYVIDLIECINVLINLIRYAIVHPEI